MDAILEIWTRGIEQLFARGEGPLNFRLFIMPSVAAAIGIRAGLKDARDGQSTFLWAIFTNRSDRPQRLESAWKGIGRIIIVALTLDTVYQVFVLKAFYIVQAVIVAFICAVVPYVLFRGPTTLLARPFFRKQASEKDVSSTAHGEEE